MNKLSTFFTFYSIKINRYTDCHLICFSDENGLYLVLGSVYEDGPAYESGLRSGDVIVTVSDWLITVMDRPQVKLSQSATPAENNRNITGRSPSLPGRGQHRQAGNIEAQRDVPRYYFLCARSEPRQEYYWSVLVTDLYLECNYIYFSSIVIIYIYYGGLHYLL